MDDLSLLGGDLNNQTKAFISFFIVLIVVGSLTYIVGQISPLAIMVEITAITFFLGTVGLLPQYTNLPLVRDFAIPIAMGMLTISYAIYTSQRGV